MATELTRPRSRWLCPLVCYSATCVWDQSSWWWAATASTVCVVQLGAVADWWCSWPMPNTLVCLCSCQRQTFWTYFVTINLFSLHLMNFMLRTMLDTAGDILRVHYKRIKCDVSISQRSVKYDICVRWTCFHARVKISSSLRQCKNHFQKNCSIFSKVMITNVDYCDLLVWFTQCDFR